LRFWAPTAQGKTTLISALCGLVTPTGGSARIGGHDIIRDYRAARSLVGLVPQEVALEPFEQVIKTVRFSRGLFGKPGRGADRADPAAAVALGQARRATASCRVG
jgi:ABC-2 type transport system ATP-binding protein